MNEQIINKRYEIIKSIGKGSMSEVFLAVDSQTDEKYAIKKLKIASYDNENEAVLRFKREAEIVSRLSHPNIIKVISFDSEKDDFYIIMEYFNGSNLINLINSLSLKDKISIISICASTLAYIHSKDIIHRDIKPGNILVNKIDNLEVKIIDFGLAYLKDIKDLFKEGYIIGSLSYISPEQTGILRRPIDNRSDLYSLGATMYEFLTGKAPFADVELGKLIHKHLAVKPVIPSLINNEIPPIIDEIIMKLLNKEPDDRYQSATGLKADLDYFLNSPFKSYYTLALRDRIEKPNYQIKTVGREEEFGFITNAYNNAINKKPTFMIITGSNGVGKSKLFEEFKEEYSTNENIVILSYNCSFSTKNTPYAPIQNIVEEYFNYWFKEEYKNNFILKIEDELSLLTGVFPFLKDLFAKNYIDGNNKSKLANKDFFFALNLLLNTMARENETVVVFIDDIEYADSDTIEFLTYISANLKSAKLLFIVTIKDTALNTHLLNRFKLNSTCFALLQLKPLKRDALYHFVNRVFSFERIYREEFYDYLYNASSGNPFYLIELLKALNENKIIYNEDLGWEVDFEKLNNFTFENDIQKLFIKRFKEFTKEERAVISNASVFGNEFTPGLLNELIFRQNNERNLEKIIYIIDKAVKANIINKDLSTHGNYYFTNNRIMHTLYKRIDKNYRKKIHLICGNLLEEKFADKDDCPVFKIAFHYNNSDSIEKKYEYNEKAYQKAIKSFSLKETTYFMKNYIDYMFEQEIIDPSFIQVVREFCSYLQFSAQIKESINYLKNALNLTRKFNWEKETIDIFIELGSMYYYLNYTDEAFRCFNSALKSAEKLGFEITEGVPYLLLGSAYMFSYQLSEAEKSINKAILYINNNDQNSLLTGYGLRSWVYIFKGEFDKAKNDVNFIEKNIQFVTDELIITRLFNYMSFYYMYSGEDINTALQYNSTVRDLSIKNNNYLYQFASLISQMSIYTFIGDYDSALISSENLIQLSQERKVYIGIENAWSTIALLNLFIKDFVKANEIAEEHLSNDQIYNRDKYSAILFQNIKALCSYYSNDFDNSLHYLDESEKLFFSSEVGLCVVFILPIKYFLLAELGYPEESEKAKKELNRILEEKPYLRFMSEKFEELCKIIKVERGRRIHFEQKSETSADVDINSSVFIKEKLQLNNVIKTSQKIASILDIDELLDVIIEKTIEVTGAERSALLLINKETGKLEYKITKTIDNNNELFTVPNYVIQKVEENKKGIVLTISDDTETFDASESIISGNIKSIICSPLTFEEKILGVLYLDSKLLKNLFTDEDLELINIFTSQAAISIINAEKNAIIKKQFSDSIEIIYSLISNNSSRVYENTQEVTKISVMLAKKLGLNYGEIEQIRVASILRDVGIISLMDKYLYSPSALTKDDREIFRFHSQKSFEVIKHLSGVDDIKHIILQHEERFNGTGTPMGLRGEDIIFGARILGIVDDFVMMLKNRQFQTHDKKERIIKDLENSSGILYDPEITTAFIELISEENLIYIINENDILEKLYENDGEWQIPSNVNLESIIVQRIMNAVNKRIKIDDELAFSLDYSLCEVVRNAIIHGNKYNEAKKVTILMKILDMDIFAKKLTFVVSDEGEGMNVAEHSRFTESRKQIIYILNRLKNYKVSKSELVNDKELETIIFDINNFKREYYTDFNAYRHLDYNTHPVGDISGGIGLIQVISTFDNVEFINIIKNNKISGLSVVMEKFIS